MTDPVRPRLLATAEILAVGTELLTPYRVDTNSLVITAVLNEHGVEVRGKSVVGDSREELGARVRSALARVDLVVVTGGLGPTDDDVTREAVAEALARPLRLDTAIADRIRARFEARGLRMPENNLRQAMVPEGARVLANPSGTAPGLWLEVLDHGVLVLPGPPREMQPMLEAFARDELAGRGGGGRIFRRVLKVAGRTESHVEELVQPVYARWRGETPPIETTILAAPGQIELHLARRAATPEEARLRLDAAVAELVGRLGSAVFSTDGRNLEEVVGDLFRSRGLAVGVAESCTGGLIASRLTDVPGSSDYVRGGVVAYSNAAKTDWLQVSEQLIAAHGAVSEPVALAMAEGARKAAHADVGVAVTGIAGPGGGTPAKPVGTVAVAVAGPGAARRMRTYRFPGGRTQVKVHAAQAALEQVRRALLDVPVDL